MSYLPSHSFEMGDLMSMVVSVTLGGRFEAGGNCEDEMSEPSMATEASGNEVEKVAETWHGQMLGKRGYLLEAWRDW